MKHTIDDLRLVESKDCFESINWKAVHELFYENNWQWGLADNISIPSLEDMKSHVLSLMIDLENKVFREGFPKEDEAPYEISSGRFMVSIDEFGCIEINLNIVNHGED